MFCAQSVSNLQFLINMSIDTDINQDWKTQVAERFLEILKAPFI